MVKAKQQEKKADEKVIPSFGYKERFAAEPKNHMEGEIQFMGAGDKDADKKLEGIGE